MSVTRRKFGKTKDGEPVTLYTITNKMGNSVSIMDYGATVQSINIVDAEARLIRWQPMRVRTISMAV